MFSALDLEPVSDPIAAEAGRLLRVHRRSHPGIDIVDHVVAATTTTIGAELKTLAVGHLPMFKGLRAAF